MRILGSDMIKNVRRHNTPIATLIKNYVGFKERDTVALLGA